MTEKLLKFIDRSPSPYHAVSNAEQILKNAEFKRLYEHKEWEIERGGKYYAIRDGSALIAFKVPDVEYTGLNVCASHTDSPSFKLKSSPELEPVNSLIRLNVEGYGGMIRESWFDRPLSVAGRITVRGSNGIEMKLVNIDKDLMIIPSLAVHMGKARADGESVNIQNELLPILRGEGGRNFTELIAESAAVEAADIKGCDLYLYNREKGVMFGAENEFIASGRIDDLENVYASLAAFSESDNKSSMNMFCAFNNEETGSLSRTGAESTFFEDTLERINESLGISRAAYLKKLASSFIMSADNAHAAHPSYMSKADPVNRPKLNGGVVIKYNASGRYTTDAVSSAIVKELCRYAQVPVQEYHNRSDIPGGSTLGNLMNRYISVLSADIGAAQLAMHSSYETAGAKDAEYMYRLFREFYSRSLTAADNGFIIE